jgi:hypothetical protein
LYGQKARNVGSMSDMSSSVLPTVSDRSIQEHRQYTQWCNLFEGRVRGECDGLPCEDRERLGSVISVQSSPPSVCSSARQLQVRRSTDLTREVDGLRWACGCVRDPLVICRS